MKQLNIEALNLHVVGRFVRDTSFTEAPGYCSTAANHFYGIKYDLNLINLNYEFTRSNQSCHFDLMKH